MLALVLAGTGCGGSPMPASAAPASGAQDAPQAMTESVQSASDAPMSNAKSTSATPVSMTTSPAPTSAKTTVATADAKKTESAQSPDFLIMYNGDVSMMVDDGKVASVLDKIIDISEGAGGHLGTRRDLGVTVRVPSVHFRETLAKVGELGEITHQSITAEDVSEEYHDAEVRLVNMKAAQKRLQEFLARSANMNDMLTLERELERISMDIDRVEGRMRFLKEHVAFSTLTIALTARPKSQPIIAGGGGGGGKVSSSPRIMHLQAEWLDNLGVDKLVN
ncbi:MAG TPA: DUF4349 domain-containing protein [Polyangiaceae bacterium]|nr:DUF4349 domain-containing protein [Polyangiaceae bacterium]